MTNVNLGGDFAGGMFLAHDGSGNDPSSFKLVAWTDVADDHGLSLTVDTAWDPRTVLLECDVNGDGCVNVLDLVTVRINLGNTGLSIDPPRADIDGNGVCNVYDLVRVRTALGEGCR